MTSFRQIEANRRNAHKSTGPITEEGKRRSRCNGVLHGLTAKRVIGTLEDAEDYQAFEAAIQPDETTDTKQRKAVGRFAKYTAPTMLALLLSDRAFAATSVQ
jgi:hypothetical protein